MLRLARAIAKTFNLADRLRSRICVPAQDQHRRPYADGDAHPADAEHVPLGALARIETERKLSADTLQKGGNAAYESHILEVWGAWYRDALKTTDDIEVGGSSAATRSAIAASVKRVEDATAKAIANIKPSTNR